ncbi:hypothetical protein WJX73_006365 [Symbiochloris irregularis]|uniref:Kinesin-like protein n=1 Tax=Symbiochloris irregularis TaxID=706552 RepID=A0AAW1P2B0_9CHLO
MSLQLALKNQGVSQATLTVAVRCRPLLQAEVDADVLPITRVVDNKMVLVLEPELPPEKTFLSERFTQSMDTRQRERRYAFDYAFDSDASNKGVYQHTVQALVPGVLKGLNGTVFAYGATGSGKTHTMVGDANDPGLMVLSMNDVFELMAKEPDQQFDVTCSYCEIYNEVIYDLLAPSSGPLDLREDPALGAVVAGLSRIRVESAERILSLLQEGNTRRKTESTDANATSSRSHAVLEVTVVRREVQGSQMGSYSGKLCMVDLAGSERASETNNRGRQLKDGAAINRSLLALANCINALGKRKKTGFVFVPFRNSKLTRLLKDGLCGNSRTAMIATVAMARSQYHHTVNTLKYADRAKEIKTHVRRNHGSVAMHVAQMRQAIVQLQQQNSVLKAMLTAPLQQRLQAQAGVPRASTGSMPQRPMRRASEPGTPSTPGQGPLEAAQRQWSDHMRTSLEHAQRMCIEAQQAAAKAEDCLIGVQAASEEMDAEAAAAEEPPASESEAFGGSISQVDLRRHNATAALREADRRRQEAVTKAAEAEATRARLHSEIASAPASSVRDKLLAEAVAGVLAIDRACHQAQAAAHASIIADQAVIIANLWTVLGWTGFQNSQVMELVQQHAALPGPGQKLQSQASMAAAEASSLTATFEPDRTGQLLQGGMTLKRHKLWTARQRSMTGSYGAGTGDCLLLGAPSLGAALRDIQLPVMPPAPARRPRMPVQPAAPAPAPVSRPVPQSFTSNIAEKLRSPARLIRNSFSMRQPAQPAPEAHRPAASQAHRAITTPQPSHLKAALQPVAQIMISQSLRADQCRKAETISRPRRALCTQSRPHHGNVAPCTPPPLD